MESKPKSVNRASDKLRRINISIDVDKIDKNFIFVGEKGRYLQCQLLMLPDGDLDKYGNLGMVVQSVPKAIRDKEKDLPYDQRTNGAILGNGREFYFADRDEESTPGNTEGKTLKSADFDDLPF